MVQECLNCIELRKRIAELEQKLFSLDKKRGEDIIAINRDVDVWHIITHKDVEGVIKTLNYYIPHSNVLVMKKFLLELYNGYDKVVFSGKGKELAFLKKLLIKHYGLFNEHGDLISNKEYFGSRSTYFDTYYYPLKILDYFKIIDYTNAGKITLPKKFFVERDL